VGWVVLLRMHTLTGASDTLLGGSSLKAAKSCVRRSTRLHAAMLRLEQGVWGWPVEALSWVTRCWKRLGPSDWSGSRALPRNWQGGAARYRRWS
jgi:hypothetical protein